MMLIPNIYRVIGNRGCNSYILETEIGLIIIDSGYLGSERAILRYLDAQLRASPEDVAYIIVTHARRNCSEASLDLLTYCDEAKLIIHKDDFQTFKKLTLIADSGTENIIIIDKKETPIEDTIKIIHTPGYTPGSISILYKDSLFIGGSVYIDHNQNINLPKQAFDSKLLLDSLKNIVENNFSHIFPSHGRYILRDGKKKLKEFLVNRS